MKKYLLAILLVIAVILSCNKLEIEKGTPKCVTMKIKDFNREQTCDDGVEVKEFIFQDETVYVFDPGNCGADMTSEVIDSDCNSLGFLGGIVGNAEINGENFSNAIFQKIIWQK